MSFDKDYFSTYALPETVKEKVANCRGFLNYLGVPRKTGRALDVGCGYGYSSTICAQYGYKVYGVDISFFALTQAKKLSRAEDVVACDAQDGLPFTEAFDLVMCFEVIEHLKNPERAFRNFFNALNPSGLLVASTPNPLTKSHWNPSLMDPTHISLKSAQEWRSILGDCGFSSIEVSCVHFIPALWRLTGRLSFLRLGSTLGNQILMRAIKP